MMKTKALMAAVAIVAILSLCGCSGCFDPAGNDASKEALNALGLTTSKAPKLLGHTDKRTGLQNDGETLTTMLIDPCDKAGILEQIRKSKRWIYGKFDEKDAAKFLNGKSGIFGNIGEDCLSRDKFSSKDKIEALYFRDCFEEKYGRRYPGDMTPNYVFGAYDADTGLLLYYRFDS